MPKHGTQNYCAILACKQIIEKIKDFFLFCSKLVLKIILLYDIINNILSQLKSKVVYKLYFTESEY